MAEDLNLRIIEIVHQNGAISRAPGKYYSFATSNKPREEALQEVGDKLVWRQGDGLPFPDLSESGKAQLKGSVSTQKIRRISQQDPFSHCHHDRAGKHSAMLTGRGAADAKKAVHFAYCNTYLCGPIAES